MLYLATFGIGSPCLCWIYRGILPGAATLSTVLLSRRVQSVGVMACGRPVLKRFVRRFRVDYSSLSLMAWDRYRFLLHLLFFSIINRFSIFYPFIILF